MSEILKGYLKTEFNIEEEEEEKEETARAQTPPTIPATIEEDEEEGEPIEQTAPTISAHVEQLNYSTARQLQLIEYPGLVVNTDRMIQTLGGITKISQCFSEEEKMELHYHADNPYNKPIGAEKAIRTGLLLSIKRRRSKKHPEKLPKYTIEIIGQCNSGFIFKNLCDFQYLPIVRDPTTKEFNNILKQLIPESANDTEFMKRKNCPMFCIPNIFTRIDSMNVNLFRMENESDNLGFYSKTNTELVHMVTFNLKDPLPTKPPEYLQKKRKREMFQEDEHFLKIKRLFETCPIWTRIALMHESGVTLDRLRTITPRLAFYYATGPWRTLYIRYNYDPRTDYRSRIYQSFDFRLRFSSGITEIVASRKDSTFNKFDTLKMTTPNKDNELTQDPNCPYLEENKLPRSRQCMFRYCDVRYPIIQAKLENLPIPAAGTICDEKLGWLPFGFDTQVREIVSEKIRNVLKYHKKQKQMNSLATKCKRGVGDDDDEEEEEELDDDVEIVDEPPDQDFVYVENEPLEDDSFLNINNENEIEPMDVDSIIDRLSDDEIED